MTSEPHSGGRLVKLSGVIDETFDRTKLAFGPSETIVFDLDNVRRITSYGVRDWMLAMAELTGSTYFVRCRPALVSHFNMVQNFGARGQLVSFYAPYACSACGKEVEVLIDRRRSPSVAALAPPTMTCPSCGGEAELDDNPDTFFSYVTSAPSLSLSALAAAMIDGTPGNLPTTRLTVAKEIQGEVTALWLTGPLDESARLKRVADGLEGVVVLVLASVTAITSEGLEHFNVFTRAQGIELYLTRVPVPIAAALGRSSEVMARAKVLSMRIPYVCLLCKRRTEIDADESVMRRSSEGRAYQVCPGCGSLMKPPTPMELMTAMRLTFSATPPVLRSYVFASPEAFLESGAPMRVSAPPPESFAPLSNRRDSFTPTPTSAQAPSTSARASLSSFPPPQPMSTRTPLSSSFPPPQPMSTRAPLSSSFAPSSTARVPPLSQRAPESYAAPPRLSRYEVLRRIGVGGMATVYLGRVVGAGGFERLVAIKIMHAHVAKDPACVAMFLDEARLAARIRHPNVVATLDIEENEEALMMVMEYVEGLTLSELNRALREKNRKLPVPVTLRIMLDALAGLHAAHELTGPDGAPLDLVHRDVSPHNLIVGVDGATRVTDFGIALAQNNLSPPSGKRGEIKGKVSYMAPEQLRSYEADRRSDIYAMGVVLWELLAGKRFVEGESYAAMMFAALQGATRAPHEVNSEVPPAISAVCMRALTLAPDGRFGTAAEFSEELERAAVTARMNIAPSREVAAILKECLATMKPREG
jgi:DNA-directed RNA polymerase subunit RPC12/RpoP